jgi:hypothetical protein
MNVVSIKNERSIWTSDEPFGCDYGGGQFGCDYCGGQLGWSYGGGQLGKNWAPVNVIRPYRMRVGTVVTPNYKHNPYNKKSCFDCKREMSDISINR